MIPLGMLGQIYAVCAGIGSIFVIGSFVMGHIGDEGGHDGGGHDDGGGSDFSSGDDGGGSDFSAGDDGGGGSDFSAGDEGGGGSDFNAGDNNGHYRVLPVSGRPMLVHRTPTSTFASGFFGIILTLLSPMTVCIYLAFFGLTGLVLCFNAPWLGYFTLIPAIAVSIAVSAAFKAMTQWMIKNMFSSTHQKESDLLGQMAEVNVPINAEGRVGEVTYVLNAKRMTATAKPAKPGVDFKKGSKVLIVGSKEHVVFIEPYDPEHDELEQRFIS
ncbi:hypothetical protein BH10CYA1_BH10CYA1_63670 [soil metagenome]